MRSINDDKMIKHLKETIDIFKKENQKLKSENKTILGLKQNINKLQEEKMELAKKLMELESEAVLYKDDNSTNDEMLYNPKLSSAKKYQNRLSFHRNSVINNSSKELSNQKNNNKKRYILIINKFSFSLIPKNNNNLKEILNNKNEEISLLKNELIRKEQIILELTKEKLKTNSESTPLKETNKISNDSIFEENDANLFLENNIYSEIQNILEEKRNFILNTLTCENFSFDILIDPKRKNSVDEEINNVEQIIDFIRQRKKKVEMTKKRLEEKFS